MSEKQQWYSSTGTLRYCNNSGWIVLDIPFSIIKYYGWWVQKLEWKKGSTPLHKGHVTVCNGKYEDGRKSRYWARRQGAIIPFKYSPIIYTDAKREYFWLKVESPDLTNVRRELGFERDTPFWPFHATVYFIER